jgi:hypothetical protein
VFRVLQLHPKRFDTLMGDPSVFIKTGDER